MTTPEKYPLLSRIDSPADLRQLPLDDLPQLCRELRQDIFEELSQNPGHLASSLGAIELTVALHYVFSTPDDRIVWDVGHQAYGHKILTGRRDRFHTNRQFGGIKPFPSPTESEYDTFACGHASNSISAALGMNVAALQQGHPERKVVAVIGDGAMSGGLAFEGLNNASEVPNNLLIILNDNNMSISNSVGGMKQYLLKLHTSASYNRWRNRIARRFERWGLLNSSRRKSLIRLNNAVKSFLSEEQNIFEGMNIRYFGPYDGHNVVELVELLRSIKDMTGPKLLHIKTVKGKGYVCAEADPLGWHAPGKFDPEAEVKIATPERPDAAPKFQDVFGHTLVELAEQNPRIIGVTPAMLTGCSMHIMQQQMPERTFDVGIAEGHAVTFSAGLAKEGLIPFCNIYSSFIQRGYDQVIHDVALSGSHVVICLDRAGLVGEDGATHHGVFDMAFLRCVPDIVVASPLNEHELRNLMLTAYKGYDGPMVIRYPRGKGVLTDWRNTPRLVEIGRGRCLTEGEAIAFLSIGPIGNMVQKVVERLAEKGVSAAHYDMVFLKPLDEEMLHGIAKKFDTIISVEDGCIQGGFGSAVMEFMADHDYHPRIRRVGVPDRFIGQGSVPEQYADCGMDADSLLHLTEELLLHP